MTLRLSQDGKTKENVTLRAEGKCPRGPERLGGQWGGRPGLRTGYLEAAPCGCAPDPTAGFLPPPASRSPAPKKPCSPAQPGFPHSIQGEMPNLQLTAPPPPAAPHHAPSHLPSQPGKVSLEAHESAPPAQLRGSSQVCLAAAECSAPSNNSPIYWPLSKCLASRRPSRHNSS